MTSNRAKFNGSLLMIVVLSTLYSCKKRSTETAGLRETSGTIGGSEIDRMPLYNKFIVDLSNPQQTLRDLESPSLVGKKVQIDIVDNDGRYASASCPGPITNSERNPKCRAISIVTRLDQMDSSSRALTTKIIAAAGTNERTFIEYGGFVVYTTDGRAFATTQPITSRNAAFISDRVLIPEAKRLIQQAGGKIAEIEFYHTHLESGESLAPADLQLIDTFRVFLGLGDKVSCAVYAVPTRGKNIFGSYSAR